MCFAPQVDVIASTAIAVVAVDAARHCPHPRFAPLAALPAVFALHTALGALVWWGLRGSVPPDVAGVAITGYLAIAYVLVPFLVPLAVLSITRPGWHRVALVGLSACGAWAGGAFLLGLTAGRGEATLCPSYIDVGIAGTSLTVSALYVVATCGALLLSGHGPIVQWGLLNALAFAALATWVGNGLPSLWCFWAACTSVFVAWFMRRMERGDARGDPWPWTAASEPRRGGLTVGRSRARVR